MRTEESLRDQTVRLLLELPDRIAGVEYDLSEFLRVRDRARESRSILESKKAFEVSSEEDSEGRKVYSNETARKAELSRRLHESESWLSLGSTIDEQELKVRTAEIEVDRLKRQHRSYLAIAGIIGAGGVME